MSDNYLAIPRNATYPSLGRGLSFDVYAQAYYDSAKSVFSERWKDNRVPRPDWVVWPVLFLLHHFVELELKEIIHLSGIIGRELDVELDPYPDNQHDLPKLMKLAESNLQILTPKLDGLDLDTNPMLEADQRELVEDLEKFTGGGVNVRYPVRTEKQGGGPSLPDGYVADIPKVMEGIDGIRSQFSGIIGYLSSIEQTLFDMRLEAHR